MMTLLVSAPVLLVGMAVGLVVGLLQALTQIQEQSIAFVPKIVVMVLTISYTLPWLVTQLIDYFQRLITQIPQSL